jgi:hypothetical protein
VAVGRFGRRWAASKVRKVALRALRCHWHFWGGFGIDGPTWRHRSPSPHFSIPTVVPLALGAWVDGDLGAARARDLLPLIRTDRQDGPERPALPANPISRESDLRSEPGELLSRVRIEPSKGRGARQGLFPELDTWELPMAGWAPACAPLRGRAREWCGPEARLPRRGSMAVSL